MELLLIGEIGARTQTVAQSGGAEDWWDGLLPVLVGAAFTALFVTASTWFVQRRVGRGLIEHQDKVERKRSADAERSRKAIEARSTVLVGVRDVLEAFEYNQLNGWLLARGESTNDPAGPLRGLIDHADAVFVGKVLKPVRRWLSAAEELVEHMGRDRELLQEMADRWDEPRDEWDVRERRGPWYMMNLAFSESGDAVGPLGGEDPFAALVELGYAVEGPGNDLTAQRALERVTEEDVAILRRTVSERRELVRVADPLLKAARDAVRQALETDDVGVPA